ncbi:unknown [Acidaminococcus sp. CAG:542]|nr:unknown [Acidaminococcus sp. CAG:542]
MEGALPVVYPGVDKVCQHIVAVGGADELVHRQPHQFGIEPGQDVPKIPGGHGEVHRCAVFDPAAVHRIRIGAEIVHDLGHQPSPVDGVGRREGTAVGLEFFCQRPAAEQDLYPGLGVIEVPFHRHRMDIGPFLGHHLELLDVADPFLGIEYDDFRFRHIGKPGHGRFPRIPGSSHQDHQFLLFPGLLDRLGQEQGQDLQGHVFKRTSRAMPQFQYVQVVFQQVQRSREIPEPFLAVGRFHTVSQFLFTVVCQEPGQHRQCPGTVGCFPHGIDFRHADGRKFLGHEQSPVSSQAIGNGVSGAHHISFPSCTNV